MRIVREADYHTFNAGLDWYADAMEFCEMLDPDNPRRAAGIMAALSPMKSWKANKNLARRFYQGYRDGTFKTNIVKATRIYNGEDPLDVLPKGKKTYNFYLNIAGDASAVTLDRHAIDIACGMTMSDDERAIYFRSKSHLADITEAYRRAAKIASKEFNLDIHPYQIQAITWVHWRQYYAQAYHGRGE